MFFEMFLRFFSDCCIFFGLLGCCPSLLPYSYPLLIPALICGTSAALSSLLRDKDRKLPGYLCACLPLLSLLMADGWREMLILIPAILYTAAIILRGEMYLEYFSYRKFFQRSLILLGALWAIISICIYIEDPKGIHEKVIFTEVILQYTLIHFLCGIVLQRQLRLGAQNRAQGEAGQLLGLLGSSSVVVAGFLLTEPLVRQGSLDILRKIVSILLIPFAMLLDFFIYLAGHIKQMVESKEYQEALENSEYDFSGRPTDYQEYMQELLEKAPEQQHSPWIMVFAALGVLLFLILMYLAFTRLRNHKGAPMILSEVRDTEKKRKKVSRLSNRGKVRQAYREFLRHERQRGFVLKSHYTTADILQKVSTPANETPAAALREVYLCARYDEEREVTREQAEAARDALRNIRTLK